MRFLSHPSLIKSQFDIFPPFRKELDISYRLNTVEDCAVFAFVLHSAPLVGVGLSLSFAEAGLKQAGKLRLGLKDLFYNAL
jgi:hypothetical protein